MVHSCAFLVVVIEDREQNSEKKTGRIECYTNPRKPIFELLLVTLRVVSYARSLSLSLEREMIFHKCITIPLLLERHSWKSLIFA